MANVLGIDFGTTKTAAARWDAISGHPKLIRLGRSRDAVPSVIHADKAGLLSFGEDASDYLQRDATGCVEQIKRQLGQSRIFSLHGVDYTAAQLIGNFLRKVREDAEELSFRREPAERVALAVPALYGPAQRDEFREAARSAGLGDFELLDEPVAAGFAYFAMAGDDPAKRVLVFDWGGGTLDLALIEQQQGAWEVHGDLISGDEYLGGEDFDVLILDEINRRLRGAGLRPYGGRPPNEQAQLRQRVRELKHEHGRKHGPVEWRLHLQEREAPISWIWSLEEFQSLFQEPLERSAQCLRELLAKSNAAGKTPDFILLVGGATLFPGLPELLEKQTSIPVRRWEHSADAVALGAATYAARGLHASRPRSFDGASRYRDALSLANADGRLEPQEIEHIKSLASALALDAAECERIERQVFGVPLDQAIAFSNLRQIEAEENLSKAKRLDEPPLTAEAEANIGLAEQLANEGKVAEALLKADLAATLSPHSSAPFLLKSRLYHSAQNYEASVANASRALDIEPSCIEARILRGNSRAMLGDAFGVIPDLTSVLEASPNEPCRLVLAAAYQECGSTRECISQLAKLQEIPGVLKDLNIPATAIQTVIVLLQFQIGEVQIDTAKQLGCILKMLGKSTGDVPRIESLCRDFTGTSLGLEPIATLQEKLWEICKLLRADTRQAASLFVGSNPLALNGSWWQSKPRFLQAIAIAASGKNNKLAVRCIQWRFKLAPSVTLEEWLSEKSIVDASKNSVEMRKLLTPMLLCEHWKNVFANSLSVTNGSGFPVSQVKVNLRYKPLDSSDWKSSEFEVPLLGPGEKKTWEGVFNETGWLGGKINEVTTSANCAEQNLTSIVL